MLEVLCSMAIGSFCYPIPTVRNNHNSAIIEKEFVESEIDRLWKPLVLLSLMFAPLFVAHCQLLRIPEGKNGWCLASEV